ncbi:MAG TPA: hypothetical protein VMI92_00440 [Steroidobacteraceae bacterium]|nr:hypothetical protein [Steroidobacteraceae bacterium]
MGMQEDYQALMEKQLQAWKVQAERFKADAEQMQAQAKEQYEKALATLQQRQAEAWDHFYKLKSANEGSWARFKEHMDQASENVKAAFAQFTIRPK